MASEKDLILGLELLTEGAAQIPAALSREAFATETFKSETESIRLKSRDWTVGRGIQGVGIGSKVTKGEELKELALRVYVEEKKPMGKVRNPVPKAVTLPEVGQLTTDVIQIGKVVTESFTSRARPAMPGTGLGHRKVTVGTFGCLVQKNGGSGALYILSNSHVLANQGLAKPKDIIVQPGIFDGGKVGDDAIAKLTDFVPFKFTTSGFPNLVDAAIAKVNRRKSVSPALRILGVVPVGVSRSLRRGMNVRKVGRTTDLTTGIITDIHFRLSLRYKRPTGKSEGRVGFRDQVLCTRYSAGGDSGSIVLNSRDRVVGLHFAGSPSSSIFNRIDHVLDLLDISIVTK